MNSCLERSRIKRQFIKIPQPDRRAHGEPLDDDFFRPSLARPKGNVTGLSVGTIGLDQKCLELLKELVPSAKRIAVIQLPDKFLVGSAGALNSAASKLNVTLVRIEVSGVADLLLAFSAIAASGADAIFMFDDVVLAGSSDVRKRVSEWALTHRLPAASPNSEFAMAGGLVSLGSD